MFAGEEEAGRGPDTDEPPGLAGRPPPADSWEEVADVDPLMTPENEPEDDLDDEEAVIKPKKRPLREVEDTKSKKEHVNVVFIGHVGKFLDSTHSNS